MTKNTSSEIPWETITDRLCSVTEAAKLLELSESMAKHLCQTQKLEAIRVGRAWIVDLRSVQMMAASRAS